jgi:hypothetical protein
MRNPDPVSITTNSRPPTWPAKVIVPSPTESTGSPTPARRSTPRLPGPYGLEGGRQLSTIPPGTGGSSDTRAGEGATCAAALLSLRPRKHDRPESNRPRTLKETRDLERCHRQPRLLRQGPIGQPIAAVTWRWIATTEPGRTQTGIRPPRNDDSAALVVAGEFAAGEAGVLLAKTAKPDGETAKRKPQIANSSKFYPAPLAASLPRSWRTARVWIWQTRLSVTPSTSPMSASVKPS